MRQAPSTPAAMLPAQLAHRRLHLDRGLMGTELRPVGPVHQATQALIPIAGQPHVHCLARHPNLGGHRRDRLAGQDGQHRPIALLDNGHSTSTDPGPQLRVARKRRPASRPITATVNLR
jgi:hypothetical protein